MELYVLEHDIAYEGTEFLGVFSTPEKAMEFLEDEKIQSFDAPVGQWDKNADGWMHKAGYGYYLIFPVNLDEGRLY